jgi:hypothetical protein
MEQDNIVHYRHLFSKYQMYYEGESIVLLCDAEKQSIVLFFLYFIYMLKPFGSPRRCVTLLDVYH